MARVVGVRQECVHKLVGQGKRSQAEATFKELVIGS